MNKHDPIKNNYPNDRAPDPQSETTAENFLTTRIYWCNAHLFSNPRKNVMKNGPKMCIAPVDARCWAVFGGSLGSRIGRTVACVINFPFAFFGRQSSCTSPQKIDPHSLRIFTDETISNWWSYLDLGQKIFLARSITTTLFKEFFDHPPCRKRCTPTL